MPKHTATELAHAALDALKNHSFQNQGYLHPEELTQRLNELAKDPRVSLREIGRSRSGDWPLWAVTLGQPGPGKRNYLWACQHHSPENEGASAVLEWIQLCLHNPAFEALLEDHVFVMCPQQNPDGLVKEGNWRWMDEVSLEKYFRYHQYDVRKHDCEHGIAVNPDEAHSMRAEPAALKGLIDSFVSDHGRFEFYLSGHSWHISGGCLYLIRGRDQEVCERWARPVGQWLQSIGIGLNPHEPISSAYRLPKLAEDLPGFCMIPSSAEMKKQKPKAGLKTHSPEYLLSTKDTPLAVVAEPHVFECAAMLDATPTETSLADFARLSASKAEERRAVDEALLRYMDEAPISSQVNSHLATRVREEIDQDADTAEAWHRQAARFETEMAGEKTLKGQLVILQTTHLFDLATRASEAMQLFPEGPIHAKHEALFQKQLAEAKSLKLTRNPLAVTMNAYFAAILHSLTLD